MALVWGVMAMILVTAVMMLAAGRIRQRLDDAYEKGFREGYKTSAEGKELAPYLARLDEELAALPPRERRLN